MIECKISGSQDIKLRHSGTSTDMVEDATILIVGIYNMVKEHDPAKAEAFRKVLRLNLGYERIWEMPFEEVLNMIGKNPRS